MADVYAITLSLGWLKERYPIYKTPFSLSEMKDPDSSLSIKGPQLLSRYESVISTSKCFKLFTAGAYIGLGPDTTKLGN